MGVGGGGGGGGQLKITWKLLVFLGQCEKYTHDARIDRENK